jgi:hypothetical protein
MILNIVIDFLRRRRHHPTLLLPFQEVLLMFDWSGFRPWLHPVSLAALVIFSCEMESQQRVVPYPIVIIIPGQRIPSI